MSGHARYDVKADAGWNRTRRDGSLYNRETDGDAEAAERWFAERYYGLHDDRVGLAGDAGYDVVVDRRGRQLQVDVVHAGRLPDGQPRPGRTSHLIVNVDSNKLVASDLVVLVEGPPYAVVGCIYTARFIARATLNSLGTKFSMPADQLLQIDDVIGKARP